MSDNIYKPITTKEDFSEFLLNERDGAMELREKIGKDLTNSRDSFLKERRQFLQNLILASITLLGFVSVFSTISSDGKIHHPNYLLFGIGFHLLLICFVLVYLREYLDKEIEGVYKFQDGLLGTFQEKINFVDQYFLNYLKAPLVDIKTQINDYTDKLLKLPSYEVLKEQNDLLEKEKKARKENKSELEFFGEIGVFLFVYGTLLIFLSVFAIDIPNLVLITISLMLFWIIFSDLNNRFWRPFFRFLKFVTRKNLF